ncbi:MAG: hypothetical protein WAV72_05185 [Bradyrhizobium sp.]
MFWAKRRFEWADYAPYQDRIEKLLMSNAAHYREFMMFSVEQKVGLSDVYVGVPAQAFLAVFDGFEPVAEQDLPKVVGLAAGGGCERVQRAVRVQAQQEAVTL